jgi:hypothetical protein
MVGEHAHADVGEHRALDVALDVLLVHRLVPDTEEMRELGDRPVAHHRDAQRRRECERDDQRCSSGGHAVVPVSDRERREPGEEDSDASGRRRREHEPDRAGRPGDDDEHALGSSRPAQHEHREGDRQRDSREGREVVDADEGRLALQRPTALELVDEPGELQQSPRRGRGAPGGDRPEQGPELSLRTQEERQSRREDRVLGELGSRDEVDEEAVIVLPEQWIERSGDDERQERCAEDPEPPRRYERREAEPEPSHGGRKSDGQDGQVGELDPDLRRAGSDLDPGLVLDVQEDRRDREPKQHRAPIETRQFTRASPCAHSRALDGRRRQVANSN